MEKAVAIFERKREMLLTTFAIITTGILSFRFYQEYQKEKRNRSNQTLSIQAQEKERLISKPKMLEILSAMRKECSDDLKILKGLFRKRRRAVFENEDEYQEEIDNHNRKYQQLINIVNDKIYKSFNISDKNFDESIQALNNDLEISIRLNLVYKTEDENPDFEGITSEKMLEILKYNNQRYFELANISPRRRSYEYLLIRIQDEIYFNYNIEVEDLMAYFEKYCKSDANFSSEIQAMQLSTSKLFSI